MMFRTIFIYLGEEAFDASLLGEAAEVSQERICDDELILVKG